MYSIAVHELAILSALPLSQPETEVCSFSLTSRVLSLAAILFLEGRKQPAIDPQPKERERWEMGTRLLFKKHWTQFHFWDFQLCEHTCSLPLPLILSHFQFGFFFLLLANRRIPNTEITLTQTSHYPVYNHECKLSCNSKICLLPICCCCCC